MTGIWEIPALIYSPLVALLFIANQEFQLPGRLMAIWRHLGVAVVMTPAIFFITWPDNPIFYLAVLSTCGFVAHADRKMYAATAKYGAGIISRILPLGIWVSFAIWAIISPAWRADFMAYPPLVKIGIIGCLSVCAFALLIMHRRDFDASVLRYFFWPIIFYGIVDVLNKTAMTSADLFPAIILYLWLQGLVTGLILAVTVKKDVRMQLFTHLRQRKLIIAGSLIICIVLMGMSAKNTAMAWTPNPAYVAAIGLLSPFWVMLFNKWRGVADKADWRPGIVIVAAVACLIAITS